MGWACVQHHDGSKHSCDTCTPLVAAGTVMLHSHPKRQLCIIALLLKPQASRCTTHLSVMFASRGHRLRMEAGLTACVSFVNVRAGV